MRRNRNRIKIIVLFTYKWAWLHHICYIRTAQSSKPVTFPLGALQGSVSKTWIQLGPNSASRKKKKNIWKDNDDWQELKEYLIIRYPKSHSVMIQKKNHTGYRNAARLTMGVKASVVFQMHITNGRKRKVKMISIKQKLDILENGEGKQKDITNL